MQPLLIGQTCCWTISWRCCTCVLGTSWLQSSWTGTRMTSCFSCSTPTSATSCNSPLPLSCEYNFCSFFNSHDLPVSSFHAESYHQFQKVFSLVTNAAVGALRLSAHLESKNSRGRGFDSRPVLGFFLFLSLSSVSGPSRRCCTTDLVIK